MSHSEEKKSLSFGFSKKHKTVQLKKSAVGENDEKEDATKDFVLSLEYKAVKSTKKVASDKKKSIDYVIPLINQNRWRAGNDICDQETKESDDLDLLAAEEILKDSARLNDEWDNKGGTGNEDTTRTVPLLMHNKVPEGFETDSKLDVNLRPEQPNDADYNQIPIEHFGMAMLRGMGWNESRGVGKQGKVIAPVEAQIRPKGLGLGADRSNNDKNSKNIKKGEESDKSEQIELKKGSYCFVAAGANKDLYGVVEGIDEDNCRVMVKLTLNGKTVNLMQCNISLVSKKEYEKFSKYLNKQKVDDYKKDEEQKSEEVLIKDSEMKNGNSEERRSHKRQRNDDYQYNTYDNGRDHRKHHKHSHDKSSSHHKHSKNKHKSHKKKSDHKHERRQLSESSDTGVEESSDHIESPRPWLQQDLRVRVVDKKFKNFYKEKVVIVDVPMPGVCVCKSSDGKVLDGVAQSSVETVVPRDDDSFVLIVSGSNCGQVGQIMKRDKTKCLALVQLLSDRETVLRLSYDDICEYVGNVHARDDY